MLLFQLEPAEWFAILKAVREKNDRAADCCRYFQRELTTLGPAVVAAFQMERRGCMARSGIKAKKQQRITPDDESYGAAKRI